MKVATWSPFVLLIAFSFLTNFVDSLPAPGDSDSEDYLGKLFKSFSSSSSSEESLWKNNRNDQIFNDQDTDHMATFIQIVIGIIIFVIVLTCATFVICCVCPICIIAKKRKRRGVVIRVNQEVSRNGNGNGRQQQQQQHQQTTNVIPPQALIAVSNNSRTSPSPYPVQESVTIVPLIHTTNAQPQQPQAYNYPVGGHQQNTSPYNYDAPPPYFEIEQQRHVSTASSVVVQQPYNPYYREEDNFVPSAPAK